MLGLVAGPLLGFVLGITAMVVHDILKGDNIFRRSYWFGE
jgi:hypothetical protein